MYKRLQLVMQQHLLLQRLFFCDSQCSTVTEKGSEVHRILTNRQMLLGQMFQPDVSTEIGV